MNAADVVRRLHQHRAWVNRNLRSAAAGLSEAELHQAFPIGQASVWKTLTHLYAAEFIWLEALQGNPSPLTPGDLPGKMAGNQEGPDGLRTLTKLAERWDALEARWSAYLAGLNDAALDEDVVRVRVVDGVEQRFATRRLDVLLHVATHAHYTAAQLVNMLRQLGRTQFPDVMHVVMARQERA